MATMKFCENCKDYKSGNYCYVCGEELQVINFVDIPLFENPYLVNGYGIKNKMMEKFRLITRNNHDVVLEFEAFLDRINAIRVIFDEDKSVKSIEFVE